jgi:hypothetical protein
MVVETKCIAPFVSAQSHTASDAQLKKAAHGRAFYLFLQQIFDSVASMVLALEGRHCIQS